MSEKRYEINGFKAPQSRISPVSELVHKSIFKESAYGTYYNPVTDGHYLKPVIKKNDTSSGTSNKCFAYKKNQAFQ